MTFGDREPLLDALTPPLVDEHLTYRQYVETFERDPKRFLPSAARSSSHDADRPRAEVTPPPAEVAERERWMHAVVDTWGRRRPARRPPCPPTARSGPPPLSSSRQGPSAMLSARRAVASARAWDRVLVAVWRYPPVG
jgi:hypothetical protein